MSLRIWTVRSWVLLRSCSSIIQWGVNHQTATQEILKVKPHDDKNLLLKQWLHTRIIKGIYIAGIWINWMNLCMINTKLQLAGQPTMKPCVKKKSISSSHWLMHGLTKWLIMLWVAEALVGGSYYPQTSEGHRKQQPGQRLSKELNKTLYRVPEIIFDKKRAVTWQKHPSICPVWLSRNWVTMAAG